MSSFQPLSDGFYRVGGIRRSALTGRFYAELEVDAHIAAGRITVYADGQDFLERAIPHE